MSLVKNLRDVSRTLPLNRVITWDKAERIKRHEEIWADKQSVVHRLPLHYQRRYWKERVLCDPTPVHYQVPTCRFQWDDSRVQRVEREHYPIIPIYPPEADEGLWGGEGVLKGWTESRPFTKKKVLPRLWMARLWAPTLLDSVLYSEILDKYMKVRVTHRTLKLIDDHFGLDLYLLETPEIDLRSKLGCRLKRELLVSLANKSYYAEDKKMKRFISEKYKGFVMPIAEAEWVGYDLNDACKKLQDIEEAKPKESLKLSLGKKLVSDTRSGVAVDDKAKDPKSVYPFVLGKLFERISGRERKS